MNAEVGDSVARTYEEVLADLTKCRRLKAWRRVPALEAEIKRLRPTRVELGQDAYCYGTAADFDPSHHAPTNETPAIGGPTDG